MGHDKTKRFPLFVKPSRKISVKDVADVMRDHYEGTPMDMTTDIGAGGNALPYRWRPMGFEWEGKEYMNERAIATQQTGFWFVGQVRSELPDEIGAVNWFGCDDAATSYLTPIYVSTYTVPECFRVGNGNMITYSPTSAFWMTNRVANACYKAYNIMFPTVDAEIDAWEEAMMEAVKKADQEALKIYEAAAKMPRRNIRRNDKVRKVVDQYAPVKEYLTSFSVDNAQKIFDKWVALEQLLLVKFIDGNVKAQNEDGSFVTNEHTDCIPAKISQPGYTDKWKECTAKDHGKTVIVHACSTASASLPLPVNIYAMHASPSNILRVDILLFAFLSPFLAADSNDLPCLKYMRAYVLARLFSSMRRLFLKLRNVLKGELAGKVPPPT